MQPSDLRGPLFEFHPEPMWIYDTETLAFLDVNVAAERKYGWSRAEFLKMDLTEIRPPEEVERLKAHVIATSQDYDRSGVWTHLTRFGEKIIVDIVSRAVTFQGRPARFVSVRDVTRLVESERERTAVLESISDGFFALDSDGCFTFVNDRATAYFERSAEDLIGSTIWNVFAQARSSGFAEAFMTAISTGEAQQVTEHFDPPGRWYQYTIYPAGTGSLTVYFKDVTETRKDQTQLMLLRQAVEQLNDVVLITEARPISGADGGPKVVFVNDAFVRMTGYEKDEILGKTPRLLQGPDTSRAELDNIRHALERCEPIRAELVNYTRAGEPFCVEMDIAPISADGGYTHFVAVQRDMTERRAADEVIRLSEERFRLLARATNDVVWDWDIDRNQIWWNDNLSDTYGHETVTGTTTIEFWSELLHHDDRERVERSLSDAIDGSDTLWREEYRLKRKDGNYAQVVDRGFIIRDASGRATRAVGSILDVTERREHEESARQSQKLEAIGQLTGGIAHDFNNLLTVILNNAEELEASLQSQPDLRELAGLNIRAAERGAELTNRLLAVARRQALSPTIVDLNALVQGLLPILRRTLGEHIKIEVLAADELWHVEADAGQVEVALLNLTINARDAMPDGGILSITLENAFGNSCPGTGDEASNQPCVRLAVTDTGQGMTEDVRARVFEPFFTTKPVGKGSGLGLSMVYGFVKQTGGEARIASTVGKGTTVELFFPSLGTTAPVEPAASVERLGPGGDEHIMVVEDDPLVQRNLTKQLEALGYRVTSAADGDEALKLLPEEPDLLLTDVVMPGSMNGRELADRAVALRPRMRVLFTSGYSQDALLSDGRLPASVHLLGKPYRRNELATKVREVLDTLPPQIP